MKKLNYLWKKKYVNLLFAIGGLLSFALLFTQVIWLKKLPNYGSYVSDYLLLWTGIIIIWYTRETRDLKRISNKQLEESRKTRLNDFLPVIIPIEVLWCKVNIGKIEKGGKLSTTNHHPLFQDIITTTM